MSVLDNNDLVFLRIIRRLAKLGDPDCTPLMFSWGLIIKEDNMTGVLAGTDKDGQPMPPVTYRPVTDEKKHINIRSKAASHLRLGQSARRKRDLLFGGYGPAASGLHNNLTSSEYRRLAGPPLAPRDQFSRVITNLRTGYHPMAPDGTRKWMAFGYWDEVVSTKGFSFLPVHFDGKPLGKHGPSKKRDLRGVRPEGRERARNAARAFAADLVRFVARVD